MQFFLLTIYSTYTKCTLSSCSMSIQHSHCSSPSSSSHQTSDHDPAMATKDRTFTSNLTTSCRISTKSFICSSAQPSSMPAIITSQLYLNSCLLVAFLSCRAQSQPPNSISSPSLLATPSVTENSKCSNHSAGNTCCNQTDHHFNHVLSFFHFHDPCISYKLQHSRI